MAVKLGRRRILQVSLEGTQGTPEAGATDVLTYGPSMLPADDAIQREPSGAYGGPALAERGPSVGTCKFKAELRSDGVNTLNAGLLICLQGCGLKLAGSVLAPVTTIADQKTITIDFYSDGRKKRLYGAMGTFEMTGEAGKQVFLDFTFTGTFVPLADAAMPAASPGAQMPMMAKGLALTIGAHSPKFSRFSINPNNPVELREDASLASAIFCHIIGPGRRYVIGIDPEVEVAATFDAEDLWFDKTTSAVSLTISDGTAKVVIAAPKVQLMAPQEGDRGSKAIYDLNMQCNTNAGDDEITFTMSAA
jgi:hypothetical protein